MKDLFLQALFMKMTYSFVENTSQDHSKTVTEYKEVLCFSDNSNLQKIFWDFRQLAIFVWKTRVVCMIFLISIIGNFTGFNMSLISFVHCYLLSSSSYSFHQGSVTLAFILPPIISWIVCTFLSFKPQKLPEIIASDLSVTSRR